MNRALTAIAVAVDFIFRLAGVVLFVWLFVCSLRRGFELGEEPEHARAAEARPVEKDDRFSAADGHDFSLGEMGPLQIRSFTFFRAGVFFTKLSYKSYKS